MGRRSRRNPDAHRERSKGHGTAKRRPSRDLQRPLLQWMPDLATHGTRTSGAQGDYAQWQRDWLQQAAETRRIVKLADTGIDWGVPPGPDDEVGYCMDMWRRDDCLQAAIATACQVPMEQVPDPRLDARKADGEDPDDISRETWYRIAHWAVTRGLSMAFHATVPVARERWIGVIGWPPRSAPHAEPAGDFSDHCLVMSHDQLVFDPSCGVRPPPGFAMLMFDPADITYGISFDKKESK